MSTKVGLRKYETHLLEPQTNVLNVSLSVSVNEMVFQLLSTRPPLAAFGETVGGESLCMVPPLLFR